MARGFVLRGIAGVRRELQCPAGANPAQRSIWMAGSGAPRRPCSPLSSRAERPDFLLRAAVWRVGSR